MWHDARAVRPCVVELEKSFKATWRTKKNSRTKHTFQRNQKLMVEINRRARLRAGQDNSLTLRLRLEVAEVMDADARGQFPNWTNEKRFTHIRAQYDVPEKAGKEPAVQGD